MVAIKTIYSVFASCALCTLSMCVSAHPFHTSHAEMEFNSKTGRYEVSLRVLGSDLEESLTRLHLSKNNLALKEQVSLPKVWSSQHAGASSSPQRVDLKNTRDVDGQIVAYLGSQISLTMLESRDEANTDMETSFRIAIPSKPLGDRLVEQGDVPLRQGVHWVGKEFDKSWMWLYFELDVPRTNGRIALTNRIFFELNAGQINLCTLSRGETKLSLRTDARTPTTVLPPEVRAQ